MCLRVSLGYWANAMIDVLTERGYLVDTGERRCVEESTADKGHPLRRWRFVPNHSSLFNLRLNLRASPGDPTPELIAQLAQETYNTDLLHLLVQNIARFEFEARKDVVQIFNNLLRRQIGTRWPTVEWMSAPGKSEVIFSTLAGYENEEIALNTGMILKEMLKHEQLCKILLYSDK